MYKSAAVLLTAAVSVNTWAQSYTDRDQTGLTVSAATGRVEIEDLEGKESIHSLAAAYRLQDVPIDLELRYSHVDWNPTITWVSGGTIVGSDTIHGTIKNIGLGAKLDLSWTCQAACIYLMAGYNTADLTIDEGGYSIDAHFPHLGIGARYDFANGLRANVEYYSYQIGDQDVSDSGLAGVDNIDFGTATAIQAGIGYRF